MKENSDMKIFKSSINPEFLLRHLISKSYDGVTVTDPNGQTIWYNEAFLRMSGLQPVQMDQYTVYELIQSGCLKSSASLESILKKKTITRLITYTTGVEALISATPVFNKNKQLLYSIANIRDLTELNKLKRQLDETYALTEGYKQMLQEVQRKRQNGNPIIYRSRVMEKVMLLAHKFASVDTPILILGESGVGKDLVANYIHFVNDRKDKGPFVKINCAAIPEQLLESVLFGYEDGAFTGASHQGKAGLFEVADKGTVFLDEIGEMPLSLQVKLLGVLQDMKIHRVGGTKVIPTDVRIIAATNANLERLIKEKKFREDLYFRLNVLSLNLPPLRERTEDIVVLIDHFTEFFNHKHHLNKSFSPVSIERLLTYSWPGNIREMKNLIERLIIVSDDDVIDETLIPVEMFGSSKRCIQASPMADEEAAVTLKKRMEDHERKVISYYLNHYKPMKRCADFLGIDLTTLARKKRKYQL